MFGHDSDLLISCTEVKLFHLNVNVPVVISVKETKQRVMN